MKKLIFTLMMLFVVCTASHSQINLYYNNSVEIGFQFGSVDAYGSHHLSFPVAMASFACYGVYADIGGWGPNHRDDWRGYEWDDEKCFAFHVGYQLPFGKYFKITPLVGYYNHQIGWTDGNDYYYDPWYDEYHNRFITEYEYKGFDFGSQVQVSFPVGTYTKLNIMGTFTNNMAYGGLGISIDLGGM